MVDFETSGRGGVRGSADHMGNYLKGTYGAIADMHLRDIVDSERTAKPKQGEPAFQRLTATLQAR